jgi:cytochrome c
LSKKGGTWNWDNLSQWLTSPRNFAPGTKMTFAGLSNPQDRADVIAFLNAHSDAPKPMPAAPAETKPGANVAANSNPPGNGPNNGPQKAETEPTIKASAEGKAPNTTGGDANGKTMGPTAKSPK